LDNKLQPALAPVVAGLGKIFIAEVTELGKLDTTTHNIITFEADTVLVRIAKDIQAASSNPRGPLQVHHLRLARLELEQRGILRSTAGGGQRGGGTGVALRPRKALFKR